LRSSRQRGVILRSAGHFRSRARQRCRAAAQRRKPWPSGRGAMCRSKMVRPSGPASLCAPHALSRPMRFKTVRRPLKVPRPAPKSGIPPPPPAPYTHLQDSQPDTPPGTAIRVIFSAALPRLPWFFSFLPGIPAKPRLHTDGPLHPGFTRNRKQHSRVDEAPAKRQALCAASEERYLAGATHPLRSLRPLW
jgi:hypothetical protein